MFFSSRNTGYMLNDRVFSNIIIGIFIVKILFALFFALIQFAVIGLTTPVIGAMVRYKVVALPFLYTIFMLCIDKDALLKKLKRSKSPDSERV